MRKVWKLVLLAVVLAVVLGYAGAARKLVFVDRVSGHDSQLVNLAPQHLTQWIRGMGHNQTRNRADADYIVRFIIVSSHASRPFNWWTLLFIWLWPIVPVTTVEADVVLAITVTDQDGREVFVNQTGAHSSTFWFAEFVSRANRRKAAFEQAFRMLTVTAYLP